MFIWSKFLLYNFLSCLVSHPDETLRKRLKEKRKGGFYVCDFIIALTSTPICMNEHEPSELCLSIITSSSASTRPQRATSQLFFFYGTNLVTDFFFFKCPATTATRTVCLVFLAGMKNELFVVTIQTAYSTFWLMSSNVNHLPLFTSNLCVRVCAPC